MGSLKAATSRSQDALCSGGLVLRNCELRWLGRLGWKILQGLGPDWRRIYTEMPRHLLLY